MVDSSKAVTLVVGLFVAGIMAAFLLPVAIGPMTDGETQTATIEVGNSTELQPDMTATLDSVDTTADSATYTINASGSTSTVTVDNGTNTTTTVDGADVTIAVTDVSSGQATAEFTSPTDYGWGSGAGALWGILPVLIVLAVFLYFVGMALGKV